LSEIGFVIELPGQLLAGELLRERVGQLGVSKTPANSSALIIAPTVTTLRRYSMPGVEVVHGRQLCAETARWHDYVDEMWKILLDFFSNLSGFFDHGAF
jgi:hypothetical protein